MTDPLTTLTSQNLTVGIAALGAEMQYLRTSQGEDLLWHGDAAFWSGRAPVLFPIVGRAVDDIVSSGGLTAPMKQHGLARRLPFALEAASSSSTTHILRATEATREAYPFDFALRVTHALKGATLKVTAHVTNEGDGLMPFGFGFHPAFRWPLGPEDAPHEVRLASGGNPDRCPLRADGLLERDTVPGPFMDGVLTITNALFEEGALVFPAGADALSYGAPGGPHLDFTFENLPDLALWRPVGAPFLCIEPWQGTASIVGDGPEISQRPGSQELAPGASAAFSYSVTYRP